MDLTGLREEYGRGGLDLPDLADDPIEMFERWLAQAIDAGVHEPNAMVVATATADGRPSSRMVLLKGIGPDGFVFFTNHGSRKGDELAANPRCALLFPWHPLERQVRIEGTASVLEREAVEAYHGTRPRPAQLGAWASLQSRPVASRDELNSTYDEMVARFEGQDVPAPEHWGGYRIVADRVEVWGGRRSRLHDRLVWERVGPGDLADARAWRRTRLQP